jgi:hypothetical protein
MKNKRLLIFIIISLTILVIPLLAMQFTDEVNWTLGDFMMAALLLGTTAILSDLVLRKINNKMFRITILVLVLLCLIIIWAQLAVGIF